MGGKKKKKILDYSFWSTGRHPSQTRMTSGTDNRKKPCNQIFRRVGLAVYPSDLPGQTHKIN